MPHSVIYLSFNWILHCKRHNKVVSFGNNLSLASLEWCHDSSNDMSHSIFFLNLEYMLLLKFIDISQYVFGESHGLTKFFWLNILICHLIINLMVTNFLPERISSLSLPEINHFICSPYKLKSNRIFV